MPNQIAMPFETHALRVVQELGTYYVAVLPARILLDTAYSDRLRAIPSKTGVGYVLEGTQRGLDPERLQAIATYICRSDSAFPNSIILAPNFRESDGTIEEDESKKWRISKNDTQKDLFRLQIPSLEKVAAVIDGQHRLFAFALAADTIPERLDTKLICSIFLDLPKPFQAQLFATINSTQKPVNKSLTYELFGYNISEENANHWSPDKLAVFLTRKLNTEDGSPLKKRVVIAPENQLDAPTQSNDSSEPSWKVSMATIVEGILKLISSNPKKDTAELLTPHPKLRKILIKSERKDKSPMRQQYLEGNDQLIFLVVRNFFNAVDKMLWKKASADSFITKTVGIQACMDVLKKLCADSVAAKDVSVGYFEKRLDGVQKVDFGKDTFRNASGSGRTQIRRMIELKIGLLKVDDLAPDDALRELIA